MGGDQNAAIELQVGDDVYAGTAGRMQIVHEALDHLLPRHLLRAHRLTVRAPGGELVYPDMFVGEVVDHYGPRLLVTATPLAVGRGPWRNLGFDHIALATRDRAAARDFFARGLKLQVMRDDPHLTVVASGHTAIFLFDADPNAPLADGIPSHIHHLGFVVDDLEAAYGHLLHEFPAFVSNFTLLERQERWSLYGTIRIGDVEFLIQLSEIKPGYRGLRDTSFTGLLYDYASRDYGLRLG